MLRRSPEMNNCRLQRAR